jgi:hypothetical protein
VDVFAVLQNRLADVFYKFIMALTGNVELSKDFLHRNYNFMIENNAGSYLLKKILKRKINEDEYELDLIGALNKFESRFMSPAQQQTLVKILQPLARGKVVKVKKVKVEAEALIQEKPAKMGIQDQDNIKNLVEMFSPPHNRAYIEQVYRMNGKNMESTTAMFCGEG